MQLQNIGRDFHVYIIRFGKMVKLDNDKFKRVYRDNGTYYYSRILENQIWKMEELYFMSCELTGSYDGT